MWRYQIIAVDLPHFALFYLRMWRDVVNQIARYFSPFWAFTTFFLKQNTSEKNEMRRRVEAGGCRVKGCRCGLVDLLSKTKVVR